ncbi:MAG: sdhA [Enterovirga sp.]|nr:sdhA [Enterovirga sp.]
MPSTIDIRTTEVLVLGGGIAGFRAAVAAAEAGSQVTIVFFARGASPYIIGCNAPIAHADGRDTPETYFDDMVRGGYGLNDRRLVQLVATEAAAAQQELSAIGVPFAGADGRLDQRHLSGNTYRRSIYVPEGTGKAILDHLHARARSLGIAMLPGRKVVRLLQDGPDVVGALLWERKLGLSAVAAKSVVVALGGIGRLYEDSTYPGDVGCHGYGLALEAGASLIDMEFVQFEPVVTVWPEACAGMEMPTGMLGEGAHLLNAQGERFMFRYNPEHGEKHIEKAKMSLCIQREIDEGRGFEDRTVLFDTTVVPREGLESYVSHCKRLRAAGVEPTTVAPRVRPAAHSQMGGVFIDETGWSGIPGLYVGGETAGGLHGASRLAGNGCSDTLVTGAAAGRGAARAKGSSADRDWGAAVKRAAEQLDAFVRPGDARCDEFKRQLRQVMPKAAGIWRSGHAAEEGLLRLGELGASLDSVAARDEAEAIEALEASRMLTVAKIIVSAVLARTESRGAHQRTDCPAQDDANWLQHLSYRLAADGSILQDLTPIH